MTTNQGNTIMPAYIKFDGIQGNVRPQGSDPLALHEASPTAADGTSTAGSQVDPGDRTILIRNHELTPGAFDPLLFVDGVEGKAEGAPGPDAAFGDLPPAADAAASGSDNWQTYRVSVDPLE